MGRRETLQSSVSQGKAFVSLFARCLLVESSIHCRKLSTERRQSLRYGHLLCEGLSKARLSPCADLVAKPGVLVLQFK